MITINDQKIALEDIRFLYSSQPEEIKELCALGATVCAKVVHILQPIQEMCQLFYSRINQVLGDALSYKHQDEEEEYQRERLINLCEEAMTKLTGYITVAETAQMTLGRHAEAMETVFSEIRQEIEAASDGKSLQEATTPLYSFEKDPDAFLNERIGVQGGAYGELITLSKQIQSGDQEFTPMLEFINAYATTLDLEHRISTDDSEIGALAEQMMQSIGLGDLY